MAEAQDNLGLKLPPSASKGKPANKLEKANLNPKFPPNFYIPNPKLHFSFFVWFSCLSLLPCWSHEFFGYCALLQPDLLICILACKRPLLIRQDNSLKDVSS